MEVYIRNNVCHYGWSIRISRGEIMVSLNATGPVIIQAVKVSFNAYLPLLLICLFIPIRKYKNEVIKWLTFT